MIYHAKCVEKAVDRALIVVDMPFGTYQGDSKNALNSAEKARKDALEGPMGQFFQDYWIPLLGSGTGLEGLKLDPDMPIEEITPEYMLENVWIVGDPEECANRLRKLHGDVGGFGTLLALCHDWGDMTPKWHKSLELLSKEVLPALSDLD